MAKLKQYYYFHAKFLEEVRLLIKCVLLYITDLQITEQPQSNTSIVYREPVNLTVSAAGAESLSYQWKKNEEDINGDNYDGVDTPSLTIKEFLSDDQGKYFCVIKSCNRSIQSKKADLALGSHIIILFFSAIHYH